MPNDSRSPHTSASRPLWLVTEAGLPQWLEQQPEALATWVRANGFQAERSRVLALPGPAGEIAGALVGVGPLAQIQDIKLWHSAGLSERLPAQPFHLATPLPPQAATPFVLGWQVGAYRFSRYRPATAPLQRATLIPPRRPIWLMSRRQWPRPRWPAT